MRAWYAGLAERERLFVNIGAIAAGVLILAGIVLPLNRGIMQARERVAHKQGDLAFIQQAAPELRAAGPISQASGASLVVLIDSSATCSASCTSR